jgi:hypothetical protein
MSSRWLLLLLGCSDYELKVDDQDNLWGSADILVRPERIDFLSVGAEEAPTSTVTVTNRGSALLFVHQLDLYADDFALVDAPESFSLEAGASAALTIRFQPSRPEEQQTTLTVHSDDPDQPESLVELLGEGRLPWLEISPATWSWEGQPLGCPEELELVLQNTGEEDLHLEELRYEGDTAFALEHALPLPMTLAPGQIEEVRVRLLADTPGDWTGALVATSDDPRGEVSASQSAQVVSDEPIIDRGSTSADPPADLLFAVDQSASMDDDAIALAESFSAFITALSSLTSDWQLGVVTLDDGCFNGGVLTADSADLVGTFTTAVSEGEDRDIVHDEALLLLADRALAQSAEGSCNEGFLREGALVHVMVISDEPERSHEEASAWTWDHWLESMQARVEPDESLVISGVVDMDLCNEGAEGYEEAIAATGGSALSICGADWSAHVAELARVSTSFTLAVPLSATPLVDSLQVRVDGSPTGLAWTYHSEPNEVVVEGLGPGAEVEVEYLPMGTCP